jgi:F0F1-type ATP synthase membrane subunit b/b'
MRFWTAYAFFAIGMASKAWSSGGEAHHGSVLDLIAPAFNVAVLVGFLVWKLKKPLHDHFTQMSENISNTLERASLKSKEAHMMLENEKRKQSGLAAEVNNIHQQAESDVSAFEKDLSKETDEKTQKLKIDANLKIQADKKELIDSLNVQLLDQVISKAKQTIKTNKEFQEKASTKLLKGLQ